MTKGLGCLVSRAAQKRNYCFKAAVKAPSLCPETLWKPLSSVFI